MNCLCGNLCMAFDSLVLKAIHDAVETALLQADLAEKNIRSRPASKLSGGMRRRLSVVCLAYVGLSVCRQQCLRPDEASIA